MAERECKARGQGTPQVRLATASQWPPATGMALTMGKAAFMPQCMGHVSFPPASCRKGAVCVWRSLLGSPSNDAPSVGSACMRRESPVAPCCSLPPPCPWGERPLTRELWPYSQSQLSRAPSSFKNRATQDASLGNPGEGRLRRPLPHRLLSCPREETLPSSPQPLQGVSLWSCPGVGSQTRQPPRFSSQGLSSGSGPELSWLVAASLRLPHPALTTGLHLLPLNPAQHGPLAVLSLLTLGEPGSASPVAGGHRGLREIGASHQAGCKLVGSRWEYHH